jgi:hypothetical protein
MLISLQMHLALLNLVDASAFRNRECDMISIHCFRGTPPLVSIFVHRRISILRLPNKIDILTFLPHQYSTQSGNIIPDVSNSMFPFLSLLSSLRFGICIPGTNLHNRTWP